MERSSSGLYRCGKSLLVNPAIAVFPDRCLFTNEPVAEHSPLKLLNVQAVGMSPFLVVRKNECYLHLPVSDTWRQQKAGRWKRLTVCLKGIGLALILGGIVARTTWNIAPETASKAMLTTFMFGSVILFIGCCIPHLEDTADPDCLARVGFLRSGLLVIDGVSKDFLAELPVASAAWYHGILGIEAIRLPDD